MINCIRTRRSIRKYQNRAVEPEKVAVLQEALVRSPSGRGINSRRFIMVEDKDMLRKLAECKEQGSQFLKDAAVGIVIMGDPAQSDVWIEDCSIAAILVQMAAHSLGLGSCWIQVRNRFYRQGEPAETYIQKLLSIPDTIKVECIISIGYPAEDKKGIPPERLQYHTISMDSFKP